MIDYIFYGSLMDPQLLERIVGQEPVRRIEGTIAGHIVEIHDPTEPHGVLTYPMLTRGRTRETVPAVLCSFNGDTKAVEQALDDYEGDGYVRTTWEFRDARGHIHTGFVFIGYQTEGV